MDQCIMVQHKIRLTSGKIGCIGLKGAKSVVGKNYKPSTEQWVECMKTIKTFFAIYTLPFHSSAKALLLATVMTQNKTARDMIQSEVILGQANVKGQ